MPRRSLAILALASLGFAALAQTPPPAGSQAPSSQPTGPLTIEEYIRPSKLIEDAAMAPWHLNFSVSNMDPGATRFITLETDGMPLLRDLARPWHNLAGLQIDPAANRSRALTSRPNKGMTVRSLRGATPVAVKMPDGISPSSPAWSPDGRWIAFWGHTDSGTWLYVADPNSGESRRVTSRAALPVLETGIEWSSDSSSIAVVLIPEKRPAGAPMRTQAGSPRVRLSDTRRTSIRTWADLLQTPDEAANLEHFTTGQLAVINVATGAVAPVGAPAMFDSVDAAPDLRHFRVSAVQKPFSYTFPFTSFSRRETVIDATGKELVELSRRTVGQGAAGAEDEDEQRGQGGQGPAGRPGAQAGAAGTQLDTSRRSLAWRPDGNGFVFLQRAREGDRTVDRLMHWVAPFGADDAKPLMTFSSDVSSAVFLPDMQRVLVTQTAGQETVVSLADLRTKAEPKRVYGFRPDFYTNPGSLVTKRGPATGSVARVSSDGASIFLSGIRYDRDYLKNAPRPFLSRVSLADGKIEEVWMSRADAFETAQMMDDDGKMLMISRQSPTEVPNDFLRDRVSGAETQLTRNIDRLPEVSQARVERVQITRADGFKFWATVTLPRFFSDGEGRKAMFWFYPSETASQTAYDESKRTTNINQFRRAGAGSMQLLTLLGWVIVEPDVPVVGVRERPNDQYIVQLRNSLAATIDELERKRLIDRRLLAIGGHSYGAFSTAHAMIQTPFFKAGIAGAGNYNRTLTPFGFQSEPRQLWEQRDMYMLMSPLMNADQLTGALLMYHGDVDQNMGTARINSERMFDALEALGKPAALYVYPYEDHGQIARETRLDMWARWIAWLDQYVKLPS